VKLGMEVGLGPGHVVLDGDLAPLPKRGTAPNFWPITIVTKRSPISATAELLYILLIVYSSVTLWVRVGVRVS